jgi:cytochrome P450
MLYENITNLCVAATDTTANTIRWALVYLLRDPAIQTLVWNEINSVVGIGRLPCLQDCPKLPYTEAFIMEVQRHGNLLPISVAHAASRDTNFRGYRIPADAMLFPNIDSVLSDQQVWGDPDVFRPDRFLDGNGAVTRPEEFIPFFVGT